MPSTLSYKICRELWRIENSENFSVNTVIAIIKGVNAIFKKNSEHYKFLLRDCGKLKRYGYELCIQYLKARLTANETHTLIRDIREWKDSAAKEFMYDLGLSIHSANDDQIYGHLNYNGCDTLTDFQMREISEVATKSMEEFYKLLQTL